MITNLQKLHDNGTFAPVTLEKIGLNGKETKFNLVVVNDRHAIDTVTDQYDLITNEMLVDSISRASEVVGLGNLEARGSFLNTNNGNSRMTFGIEGGGFQVPGDESDTITTLNISNNYAGRGRFGVEGGAERIVCANGMKAFVATGHDSRMHVGVADLDAWALDVIAEFAGKQSIVKMLAEVTANADWSPTRSGEALLKTAPKRYRERLADAVKDNTRGIGFNAWAAIQAVTEVATHDMKDTVSARKWSDQAIDTVLAQINADRDAIAALAGAAS